MGRAIIAIFCGLALLSAFPACAAPAAWHQDGDGSHHLRGVVDRTQNDLQAALQIATGSKDHQRYRRAQRELSDFDRKLSRGHFDEGKLKDCIGAINDVLDHNTLQPSTRDALRGDNQELRNARDRRQH